MPVHKYCPVLPLGKKPRWSLQMLKAIYAMLPILPYLKSSIKIWNAVFLHFEMQI